MWGPWRRTRPYDLSADARRGPAHRCADGVEVAAADPTDAVALGSLVAGQQAVVIAVGTAPGRRTTLFSEVTAKLITAMRARGVSRLVAITGVGASETRGHGGLVHDWLVYSFHAPEVECIGKGKARAPYEFGVKVSIVTTNACAPGGQFVLHAAALPGNPYDGHTLRAVIEDTQRLTGREIERVYVDKGYRGHDAPKPRSVFISGQKRGVFGAIKRELRRRSAVEPLIGHMKEQGHLGRCYLKGHAGAAANAILTAAGHNFRRILAWLRIFLCLILAAMTTSPNGKPTFNPVS